METRRNGQKLYHGERSDEGIGNGGDAWQLACLSEVARYNDFVEMGKKA